MWHKFKKDLFSYYSKKVNGIMRTCHRAGFTLSLTNILVYSPCDRPLSLIRQQGSILALANLLNMASVAQLDVPSDWRPGGRGFNPRRGR